MSQKYSHERAFTSINAFHLAGIVPVSGQPLDYDLPWHDCLQPISQNFLAVERAVLECATAGCERPTEPLIRKRGNPEGGGGGGGSSAMLGQLA